MNGFIFEASRYALTERQPSVSSACIRARLLVRNLRPVWYSSASNVVQEIEVGLVCARTCLPYVRAERTSGLVTYDQGSKMTEVEEVVPHGIRAKCLQNCLRETLPPSRDHATYRVVLGRRHINRRTTLPTPHHPRPQQIRALAHRQRALHILQRMVHQVLVKLGHALPELAEDEERAVEHPPAERARGEVAEPAGEDHACGDNGLAGEDARCEARNGGLGDAV